MFIVLTAVIALLIFGIWRLSRGAALLLPHRVLHYHSLLFTIALAVVTVRFFSLILLFVNQILTLFSKYLYMVTPLANVSAAFFWLVTLATCLLFSIAYCVLVYLLYLLLLLPLSKRNYRKPRSFIGKLRRLLTSLFYDYRSDGTEITPISGNIGHWIRYMRNLFGILLISECLGISAYLHFNPGWFDTERFAAAVKSLYMIPMISFFFLDQIVIFLQAERQEELIRIGTETVNYRHYGEYYKFIEIFKHSFGDSALIQSYYQSSPNAQRGLHSGVSNDQKAKVSNPNLLEAACRSVQNAVDQLSPEYINALIDLINKKSIAVMDSIHGEFVLYLLAYIQQQLFFGERALIICSSKQQVKSLIKQYREVFRRLNKIYPIWRIRSINELPVNGSNTDIIVCTTDEIMECSREVYPQFFNALRTIVLLDAYGILTRENQFNRRFFESLNIKERTQLVLFLSENNTDIITAVRERSSKPDIKTHSSINTASNTSVLCWRMESFYNAQQIIDAPFSSDIGIGYTIALIAAYYGVKEINMYAPSDVALDSYSMEVNAKSNDLATGFFGVNTISMQSIVQQNPIVAHHSKDLSFDIIYDENNNLPDVVQLALSDCADVTTMVHVISRPYMLRDFFAYNLSRVRQVPMLVRAHKGDLFAPSAILLIRLREHGMSCEEIRRYMGTFDVNEKNIEKLLRIALSSVFGKTRDCENIYRFFTFQNQSEPDFRSGKYYYQFIVKLTDEALYSEVCEKTVSFASVLTENGCTEPLPFPKKAVYNYYLPSQTMAFGGKRYFIESIMNGVLTVRPEESVMREQSYTNVYSLPLARSTEEEKKVIAIGSGLTCELFFANVRRTITGYYAHTNGLDFASGSSDKHTLGNAIEEESKAPCLHLRLQVHIAPDSNCERAAALFVILFRGILETVLPKNHKDILVVSNLDRNSLRGDLFSEEKSGMRQDPIPNDLLKSGKYDPPMKDDILALFPEIEDTDFEKNTMDCLHLYFINFPAYDFSLLETVANRIPQMLSLQLDYLTWVLEHPEMKRSYLKFGYRAIPALFDTAAVFSCLQQIAMHCDPSKIPVLHSLETNTTSSEKRCSFCGCPLPILHWESSDDRNMCEECHAHLATQQQEIDELLKDAYSFMESFYRIKLPENIRIRFKPATKIRRYTNIAGNGRVLGFYNARKRLLWVERGGPRACVFSTIVHELTHVWQHDNLNMSKLNTKLTEGHSVYVEIEALRKRKQVTYAAFYEACTEARDDDYGKGYLYWKERMREETENNIFDIILEMAGR